MTKFQVDILYSQIAVFSASLRQPFNDWSRRHVEQGFSWRKGSVSFRTAEEVVEANVEFLINSSRNDIVRLFEAIDILALPFSVSGGQGIEIGSISSSVPFDLPDGEFGLFYMPKRVDRGVLEVSITLVTANALDDEWERLRENSYRTWLMEASPA
jgi:hypothetical protein